jgi:hypothetical protein
MPWRNFIEEFRAAVTLFVWRKKIESQPLPEELVPLTELYTPDEVFVTSAETRKQLHVIQSLS